MQKAWLTGRFIDFLLHSGNRYRVHSPYLYSLIGEVIRNDKKETIFVAIEQIRQECTRCDEIIRKTDFGGSWNNETTRIYPVKISKIARTSLAPPRQARRLYRLVRCLKASRIIEIGTSLGITTSYLALANPDADIITLEGCPELSSRAKKHFNRLGIKNIELIEGEFKESLPEALKRLGTVDLVFIDGNHDKEALIDYYKQCVNYSLNETIMVLDDIHSSPGMEEAWEMIRQKEEVRISLDLFTTGWVIFRKESSKQHFKLRYI